MCTRLYNPLCLSVGRSVGRSVDWSVTLYFFYDFISLTSLLLPKWSGDLKNGPCPPARDFGRRVSGLVFIRVALHLYTSCRFMVTTQLLKSPFASLNSFMVTTQLQESPFYGNCTIAQVPVCKSQQHLTNFCEGDNMEKKPRARPLK